MLATISMLLATRKFFFLTSCSYAFLRPTKVHSNCTEKAESWGAFDQSDFGTDLEAFQLQEVPSLMTSGQHTDHIHEVLPISESLASGEHSLQPGPVVRYPSRYSLCLGRYPNETHGITGLPHENLLPEAWFDQFEDSHDVLGDPQSTLTELNSFWDVPEHSFDPFVPVLPTLAADKLPAYSGPTSAHAVHGFTPEPTPQANSKETMRCLQGCPGSFRRPGDYRRHMRKHEKPRYKCVVVDCDKTFYRADKLRDHIKKGHKLTL
jgi:hypothetical protein